MLRIFSPGWSGRLAVPKWLQWLIAIGALIAMVPVFYAGIYNHPCPADDYQNAYWRSFSGAQWDLYLHWSGRYFNNLAVSLCPLHWHSFAAFRAVVILVMLAFACSFCCVIIQGLRRLTGLAFVTRLAIGAAMTALLFNNFPSLSEGFFWYSGEVTYVLPATAALCLSLVLIRVDESASIGTGTLLLAVLLAAAAIGGNEIVLAFCDAIVFAGWIYYRNKRAAALHRFYSRLLLACILFTAAAILAPGNFMRQDVNPRNVAMVPPTWLYFSQKVFFQWLLDPYLLAVSALALALFGANALRRPLLHPLAAFLLPFSVILLLSFPAHYALGKAPPPRVMNMVYTFFLIGWMVFLLHLHYYMNQALDKAGSAWLRQACAIAVLLLLLASINTHDLRKANLFAVPKSLARGIPQGFNAELNARYQRIAAAVNDTAHVAPLRNKQGNALYIMDIIDRPTATGGQYGAYWGAKMVVVDTAIK
jgi:hypothetical protein